MENHLVEFNNLEWIEAGEGIRFKCFEKGGKTIRLMELSDIYCDKDWCMHGHIAYILDGKFTVKFEDHVEKFIDGNVIFIPTGTKHIAMVEKGCHLTMISFEI